jgi:hypothetical protein
MQPRAAWPGAEVNAIGRRTCIDSSQPFGCAWPMHCIMPRPQPIDTRVPIQSVLIALVLVLALLGSLAWSSAMPTGPVGRWVLDIDASSKSIDEALAGQKINAFEASMVKSIGLPLLSVVELEFKPDGQAMFRPREGAWVKRNGVQSSVQIPEKPARWQQKGDRILLTDAEQKVTTFQRRNGKLVMLSDEPGDENQATLIFQRS